MYPLYGQIHSVDWMGLAASHKAGTGHQDIGIIGSIKYNVTMKYSIRFDSDGKKKSKVTYGN